MLANSGIAISMDGKGAWRDNVFVQRLWRSVKYEEVYLRAYEGVSDARASTKCRIAAASLRGIEIASALAQNYRRGAPPLRQ